MLRLNAPAPQYLMRMPLIYVPVIVTGMWAAVMMLVFIPFSHNPWLNMSLASSMGYVVLFYMICLAYLMVSRTMMYLSRSWLKVWHACLWVIMEVLFISAFYASATLAADVKGTLSVSGMPFWVLCFKSVAYCFLAILLPSLFSAMLLDIRDKENTIRMINYGNVVSDVQLPPQQENKITLFDNNGVLKLSINESNLLYIESDDNYVKVWYNDNGGVIKQYMLRCRLKTIEESFHDSNLVRCHRKYIINMMRVRLLSKSGDGYSITLDDDSLSPIPVTKTYEENVLQRFNSR